MSEAIRISETKEVNQAIERSDPLPTLGKITVLEALAENTDVVESSLSWQSAWKQEDQ